MNTRALALSLLAFSLFAAGGSLAFWLIDTGRWTPANPSETEYPVRGIDVSRHQGTIDWPQVAASGVDFVYMKATEGGDWTDPEFSRNWREAGANGLARGVYHFFTFCRDADEQADHALGVLPPEAELPFAVDVEYGGNCENYESRDAIQASLDRFIERVTDAIGRAPLIYAVHDSYPDFAEGRYPESPLWMQHVIWEPSPEAGRDWTLWQYSVYGEVPGIEGAVDLNVFNGDEAAFEAFQIGG